MLPLDSPLQFFVGGNWKCVSARSASPALRAFGMSVLMILETLCNCMIFLAVAALGIPTGPGRDFCRHPYIHRDLLRSWPLLES